jgi:hypothetical protein
MDWCIKKLKVQCAIPEEIGVPLNLPQEPNHCAKQFNTNAELVQSTTYNKIQARNFMNFKPESINASTRVTTITDGLVKPQK